MANAASLGSTELTREQREEHLAELTRRTYREREFDQHGQTDRMFAWLMIAQWIGAIAAAVWLSPLTWAGAESSLHLHVQLGVIGGGLIASIPCYLAWKMPGELITRCTIASAQMLFSGLLIHLTGGRIETHFHVFGSLAFLALYREFRIIIVASGVIGADHILRSIFWPQTVFGVEVSSWWRPLEHVGWVVFEDTCLFFAIRQIRAESWRACESHLQVSSQQAQLRHTVDHLLGAVQAAADGDLTKTIDVDAAGEVSELARGLRKMQTDLRDMIGKVAAAANAFAVESDEIVEGAQMLNCGAIEQQRATSQVCESVRSLNDLINRVNENLASANELAKNSSSLLESGERDMQASMQAITRVEESSLKIGEITHAIQDIAAQTHLLALNATIEASRAGEAGKGFAVVATEVKELAKQVSNSADEITALSEEVNGRVREGVTLIGRTGDSMQQIGQRVQETTAKLGAISTAANEQLPRVEEVEHNVSRISQINEHTVTHSSTWADRGKNLEDRASGLQTLVTRFRLESDESETDSTQLAV